LQGQIQRQRRCGGGSILLRGLEAEHQYGVFAGSGGQTADFEAAGVIADSGDFVRAAFRRYGGTGDRLSGGANEAGLHIRSGYSGENQ
jgi:hypothetical protein